MIAAASANDADFTPPTLWVTTLALGLGTFMRVLDTTIANVSLPTIAGNLGVSYNDSTWVVTSFTVCMAITLPLTGFLSRRFGEVRLFAWCTILFALASLMCGLSDSFGMLLVFRALQGALSGPVYPLAQSLMIATYPKDKRGMALAIIAMIAVVAPVVGPVLGGWITDRYSWHWIFFINVPIGLFAGLATMVQLSRMHRKTERPRMDYVGLVALIAGVGSLQVVLDRGQDLDWFHSTQVVALSIIAAFALIIFVIWELTDDAPIVDLKLFRHRNFAVGTVVLILSYAVFFGISLLLPLWTQRVLHYDALWAGLAMAPVGVVPVCATYFVGKYGPRFDLRLVASLSFVVIAVTCVLNAGFTTEVDFTAVALNRLFQGIGVALFFMPILTILLSDLKGDEIASGSGLSTFLYQMGASFSASIVTFAWDRGAATDHTVLTQFINPGNPLARHAEGVLEHTLGASGRQAMDVINDIITQQGLQISFNHVMVTLAILMLALIPALWLTRPPFIRGGGGGGR